MKAPVRTGEGGLMLWTVVAILVILWLLGALGTVSLPVLSGNTVHLLLVIVIVIVVIQLLQRRRL
jgi:uncharacterized protein with PQ loop repeat